MMRKAIYLVPLVLVVLAGAVGWMLGNSVGSESTKADIGAPIVYNAKVCVYKNGELITCKPNVLTNAGKELIEAYLAQEGLGPTSLTPVKYIAVGNGTAPSASSTSLDSEITDCGLARAAGTYSDQGVGNWSFSHTWTCECDGVTVSTTGIFNASSGGTMFAGMSFNPSTLYSDDQLTVTWYINVTEAGS